MKTPYADPRSRPGDLPPDADELRSQELREAIAKYIETKREQLKALRKMLN